MTLFIFLLIKSKLKIPTNQPIIEKQLLLVGDFPKQKSIIYPFITDIEYQNCIIFFNDNQLALYIKYKVLKQYTGIHLLFSTENTGRKLIYNLDLTSDEKQIKIPESNQYRI